MRQQSFSDAEYAGKKKQTRREVFLEEMDRAVPWSKLEALIAPYYPRAVVSRTRCQRCCAFTACSNGTL